MRNIVAASIAAFAALVITSNMAATAVNDRAARMQHEGWGGLTEMAQATPAPEIWFIKGVVTINGQSSNTRYVVPNEDGQPAILTFESKEECEDTRANDPDIAGPLALFEQAVASRGGTTVVTCELFEHPPKGESL